MLLAPEDLDESVVLEALAGHWGLDVAEFSYAPLGFGSHHWRVTEASGLRWIATVDDLDAKPFLGNDRDAAFVGLAAAYDSASLLRDREGLSFVLAPERDDTGVVVHRLTGRWSVCVVRFAEGRAGNFDDQLSDEQADQLARLLAELHATRPVEAMPPPRSSEEEQLPMHRLLCTLDQPWTGGPYTEAARQWCLENAARIEAAMGRHAELSASLSSKELVVTHGEPHPGNLIITSNPADPLLLIDWDTLAIAHRERDVWLAAGGVVGPVNQDFIERYEGHTGRSIDHDALELTSLTWLLTNTAGLVADLRNPHTDNPDTATAWSHLSSTFA